MLGGDKTFNDRLCWALTLPLAALTLWFVDVVFLALEVLLEGDDPGRLGGESLLVKSVAGGYAAVIIGARVAPAHKFQTALVLGAMYLGATLFSGALRAEQGRGPLWVAAFVLFAFAGVGAAAWKARSLKADDKPAQDDQAPGAPPGA